MRILKLYELNKLVEHTKIWKKTGDKVIFTNGCFDILHPGHINLFRTSNLDAGDRLVVAINSDESIKRIKGSGRPINDQYSRAIVLSAIKFIDAIIIFEEDTPEDLIRAIRPDVIIKGGDYKGKEIVGAEFVKSYGGEVRLCKYTEGFSTTKIIEKLKQEAELKI